MQSFLGKNFPLDKLSSPQYEVVVDKDVYVTMRDGVKVCVDIYRPKAEGSVSGSVRKLALSEGSCPSAACNRFPYA